MKSEAQNMRKLIKFTAEATNLPQDQRSLRDQLTDLITIANRHGLYDAADFIRYTILKLK